MIIDTNVTIRGSKARERTLAVAAFLMMLRALAVPVNLFVACGRSSALRMENLDTLSVASLLHFILDLETVAHLPSTPLDLLQSLPSEMKTQPVVVFGDGISEQLLSPVEDVKEVAKSSWGWLSSKTKKVFTAAVNGTKEYLKDIKEEFGPNSKKKEDSEYDSEYSYSSDYSAYSEEEEKREETQQTEEKKPVSNDA